MKIQNTSCLNVPYLDFLCSNRIKKIFFTFILQFSFNPFPNKPWFLHVYGTSLLKTLWEKEKMLVTSIFSFSNSVFYSIKEINHQLSNTEFTVCKCFQFGNVQNSVVWERVKVLNH